MMLKRLSSRKMVWKNFAFLTISISVIIIVASTILARSMIETVEHEFDASNVHTVEKMARAGEETFSMCRRIGAWLISNQETRYFFDNSAADVFYEDACAAMMQNISAYRYAFSYIHSIYVYAPERNVLATHDHVYSANDTAGFPEGNWQQMVQMFAVTNTLYPRKVNNMYPYVFSTVRSTDVNGYTGSAMINVDIRELDSVFYTLENEYSELYIVNGQGQLLYRDGIQELFSDAQEIERLAPFSATKGHDHGIYRASGERYAYAQHYDAEHDWYYIAITNLTQYGERITAIYHMVVLIALGTLLIGGAIASAFSIRAYRPIHKIQNVLRDPEYGQFSNLEKDAEIQEIIQNIMQQMRRNTTLYEELKRHIALLNDTRIQALQAQINPHFISNTLGMIALSVEADTGSDHVAVRLSKWLDQMMSYALEKEDTVLLTREIDHARIYASILMERYGNQFSVQWEIDEETFGLYLPRLILQPLIENAAFHGLSSKEDVPGLLFVTSRIEADSLVLEIRDNGLGMPLERLAEVRKSICPGEPAGDSIGLSNVAVRLRLIYGEQVKFEIDSAESMGTSIKITLPVAACQAGERNI